jgi:hypothetical protein
MVTDYSALRSMYKRALILTCAMASLLITTRPASAAEFPHTYTLTIHYENAGSNRIANAVLAFQQMQAFLRRVRFVPGVEYSFNRDVLAGPPLRNQGYVDTSVGFADGIGDPASALNLLFHRALFWDKDGSEQPIFEVVEFVSVKNDRTFGAFAVDIAPNATDFTWRLNDAYFGVEPHISCLFDVATATITLTVSYSNAVTPPAQLPMKVRLANLARELQPIIGSRRLGVSIISADDPDESLNINQDAQVPIASAWKGPGVIYFFENVSPTIWNSVPIRYWHTADITDVPIEYRDALLKNRKILWDVYTMAVFSGNHEAGNVLNYIFRLLPKNSTKAGNAIIAFNDWSQQTVGISSESGMFNWHYGELENDAIFDPRYVERQLIVNGDTLFYANMFSAHDLALFYLHLATVGKTQGYYQTAVDLLSIRNPIVSKIEGETPGIVVQTATKDGYFDPGSPLSRNHSVDNDAGLLIFPDGRIYVVAFTAFDAVDIEGEVIDRVLQTLAEK